VKIKSEIRGEDELVEASVLMTLVLLAIESCMLWLDLIGNTSESIPMCLSPFIALPANTVPDSVVVLDSVVQASVELDSSVDEDEEVEEEVVDSSVVIVESDVETSDVDLLDETKVEVLGEDVSSEVDVFDDLLFHENDGLNEGQPNDSSLFSSTSGRLDLSSTLTIASVG